MGKCEELDSQDKLRYSRNMGIKPNAEAAHFSTRPEERELALSSMKDSTSLSVSRMGTCPSG